MTIAVQHLSGNLQRGAGADHVVTRKVGERKRISSLVEARVRRKNQRFEFAKQNGRVESTNTTVKKREEIDLVEPTQLETQIDIDGQHIIDLLTPPTEKHIDDDDDDDDDKEAEAKNASASRLFCFERRKKRRAMHRTVWTRRPEDSDTGSEHSEQHIESDHIEEILTQRSRRGKRKGQHAHADVIDLT